MSLRQRVTPFALPVTLALLLAACGGGNTDGPEIIEEPVTHQASVSSAAGPREARLPCNQEMSNALCDLRMYQVLVDSFIDGDPDANFNAGEGPSHHKGDLQGVINSLDYIKSTGANTLWITPVFLAVPRDDIDLIYFFSTSAGYHASDYFSVDGRYGTSAQLKTLVDEAHKRGLYVVMDASVARYRANIVRSPGGLLPANGPCLYAGGIWPDDPLMPCADHAQAATQDFFKEMLRHWIVEYKIDGWRLDGTYGSGSQVTLQSWRELQATVKEAAASVSYVDATGATVQPLGYLAANIAVADAGDLAEQGYGSNAEPAVQSAFDYPAQAALLRVLTPHPHRPADKNAAHLLGAFTSHAVYPDHALPNLMLGTHTMPRFGDLIQRAGAGEPDQAAYWARHRAAFAFMAARSGPLTLYYGDETGQEVPGFAAVVEDDCGVTGGPCDEFAARTSGQTSAFNEQQTALKDYVAMLLKLRDSEPALARGARTHVYADSNVYIDRKDYGDNRVLFVLNAMNAPARIQLDAATVSGAPTLQGLADTATINASDGKFVIELPPLGAAFYRF